MSRVGEREREKNSIICRTHITVSTLQVEVQKLNQSASQSPTFTNMRLALLLQSNLKDVGCFVRDRKQRDKQEGRLLLY